MDKYRIIETGGKQYLVKPGDVLRVELLTDAVGSTVSFTDKLSGESVKATIAAHGKAATVRVIKFRNKTRGLRRRGQRQAYSELTIEAAK